MKWWTIISCLWLVSCVDEAKEKSITSTTVGRTDTPANETPDTSVSIVKDSASHPSFTVPEIKKPSGFYQFFLDYEGTRVLHTIVFQGGNFRLEEEYHGRDSIVVTEGTWAPSQGFIWLYKEQLVRGRYVWKGDTLQYFSPRLNKRFSMTKLTPAAINPVFQTMKKQGAVLYGVGTEPFWAVEVKKNDSIILSMPDWTQPLRVKLGNTEKANKRTVYTAIADSLQVIVEPFFCSDGMSDFIYSHRLSVKYNGQTYNGCGIVF